MASSPSPSPWRRLARGRESVVAVERVREAGGGGGGGAPMAAPGECPCRSATFFRRVRPVWMAIVAAGMGYYGWAVFSPATIPYDSLGPLGTFTRYLVENHKACLNVGYGIVWLIHVTEALYALKLCREKGVTDGSTQFRWVFQTFLFGIFSLSHLLNYDPTKETKHQ